MWDMAKFKNIRIKKRGGGTRFQKVKVLASGKYKFVKNPKSKSSNPRPSRKARKVRKVVRKRYSRKRRRRSTTIPMAPMLGIIAGLYQPITRAISGDFQGALHSLRDRGTGFDDSGNFHFEWLIPMWGPIISGLLIHKFVGGWPLNLNRTLAAHRVPLIRI